MLPYGRHQIDEDDITAVVEVLRSDFLTGGPAVERFESALAEATGADHAVACANGTAALHLATMGLGLGPGQAAVVPAMTFLATANAVRFTGAEVVFADVDPQTGLMGPEHLEEALSRAHGLDVRAVIPVHLNGQCVDLATLAEAAAHHGLDVVADSCHALGARYATGHGQWLPVGCARHAQMECFSFHPVKTVAMGEGGAVTTNDGALAARLRRLRNHGVTRDPARFHHPQEVFGADGEPLPWYYEMHELGYNYRASDIHCALGASQLARLGDFVERRRELVERYDARIRPLAPLVEPPARAERCIPAWHLYPVRIDFDGLGLDRATVMHRLRAQGVGTQVHYIPVNRQPYYRDRYGEPDTPGADAYYARTLSLPLFPGMSDDDVEHVVEGLAGTLQLERKTAGGRRVGESDSAASRLGRP